MPLLSTGTPVDRSVYGQSLDQSAINIQNIELDREQYWRDLHAQAVAPGFIDTVHSTIKGSVLTNLERLGFSAGVRGDENIVTETMFGNVKGKEDIYGNQDLDEALSPGMTSQDFDRIFATSQPNQQRAMLGLKNGGNLYQGMPRSEFNAMLYDAGAVFENADVVQQYAANSSTAKQLVAGMVGGLMSDPLMLLPIGRVAGVFGGGLAAYLAKQTLMARAASVGLRAAEGGAMFPAITVTNKILNDQLTANVMNQPGFEDEGMAALESMKMGIVMMGGFSAVANVYGHILDVGVKSPAAQARLQRNLTASLQKNMDVVKSYEGRSVEGVGKTEAAAATVTGKTSLDSEVAANANLLQGIADNADHGILYPTGADNQLNLVVLDPDSAANVANIARIRAAHDPAGITVHVIEHPEQAAHDALKLWQKVLDVKLDAAKEAAFQPSAWNLFSQMDWVNSKTAWFGSKASKIIRSSPTVMRDILSDIAPFSEGFGHDFNIMGGTRANAYNIREALIQDRVNMITQAVKDFKKDSGRGVTNEDWTIAVDELRRREREYHTKGTAPADNPALPSEINNLARTLEAHFNQYGKKLKDAGLVPVTASDYYAPHAFDHDLVSANKGAFKTALINSFREDTAITNSGQIRQDALLHLWHNAGAATKKEIADWFTNESGIIIDPKMSRTEIAKMIDDAALTNLPSEASLRLKSHDISDAYHQSLENIYETSADNTIKNMLEDRSGRPLVMASSSTPDNLKARVLTLGLTPELRKFQARDVPTLINRYHAQIDGELAFAQMIQHNKPVLAYKDPETGLLRSPHNAWETLTALAEYKRAFNEEILPKLDASSKSVQKFKKEFLDLQHHSLEYGIKKLIGQTHYADNVERSDAYAWISRNAQRDAVLTYGGSMAVPNVLDGVSLLVNSFRPGNFLRAFKAIREVTPLISSVPKENRKAFAEVVGMVFEGMTPLRFKRGMFGTNRGFGGDGIASKASEVIDYAYDQSSRRLLRVTGLDHLNNVTRNLSAKAAWHAASIGARKLEQAIVNAGGFGTATEATIVAEAKKLGLSTNDLIRLSKTGIKGSNVRYINDEMHALGRTWGENTPFNTMARDEFLKSDRPVMMDFRDLAIKQPEVFERLRVGLQAESRHYFNVTPGLFDRPEYEDRYPIMRLINQFTSFMSAYSSQRLRTMAQMPAHLSAQHLSASVMAGFLTTAAWRDVSGQRRFEDSLGDAVDNPLGAIYVGVGASGVAGSFMRLSGVLDSGGIGLSKLLGVQYAGGVAGAAQRAGKDTGNLDFGNMLAGNLGPVGRKVGDTLESTVNWNAKKSELQRARSTPLQSFLWSKILNRAVGDIPFVPSADAVRRKNQGGPFPR